jgi:hypothetical protein
VLPVPFLTKAERIQPLSPINCQNAIEVIDLVLK